MRVRPNEWNQCPLKKKKEEVNTGYLCSLSCEGTRELSSANQEHTSPIFPWWHSDASLPPKP
jgi:hypothetical protein